MRAPDAVSWSGDPRDEQRMTRFLRRGNRPGERVIWWLEPDFEGSCDLLITREGATGVPLRVRPGGMLRLSAGEFSVAAARGVRSRSAQRKEGS